MDIECMSDSEKLNQIYFMLKDENVGLCARVKKLEHTVNGNGKTGLAEEVRNLKWRWGLLVAGVAIVASWLPKFLDLLAKKIGG